ERHQFHPGDRPLLALAPAAKINAEAEAAISEADLVVVGPGGLYDSILPVLLPVGMAPVLRATSTTKVYVSNLVSNAHDPGGMMVHDYVSEIERHLGEPDVFDYVLYNT